MLQVKAYAKINPYLAVTGRREDGYHTILSHMQAVSLCDELSLAWTAAADAPFSVRLTCSDAALACDDSNLVCRAAKALAIAAEQKGCAVGGELTVHLQKNIPMAAGLAGGSADAAATLRAFNALLGHPLDTDELCEIAVLLGADIPFCIRCIEHGAMTARGIGEVLTSAPTLPSSAHLVIACHGEGVSTPWAYRKLDELGMPDADTTERTCADFLAALERGDLAALASHSHNCFERVVLPEREAVGMLMNAMTTYGAVFARMSGSGPSVVGYFDSECAAKDCARQLAQQGVRAYCCQPMSLENNSL